MTENILKLIAAGNDAQRRKAADRAEQLRWFAEQAYEQSTSLTHFAHILNELRINTPSGRGRWSKEMARRLLIRLDLYQSRVA